MKIAYFSNSILPSHSANSLHVMKMCQALAENDHEVILLAPDKKDSDQDIFSFYGVNTNFTIKKISVPKIKGGAYIYALKSALIAKKFKVNIGYGRFIQSCFFASLLKIPTIYEAHGTMDNTSENLLFKLFIKSKYFKGFTLMSYYLKGIYKKSYKIPENKITVAYNGADNTDKTTISFHNKKQIQVGYIGSLYTGKGMEIVSKLVKLFPECFFHIIGGENVEVEKWRKEFDDAENVTFYGFIEHDETIKYRNSFDILLCPAKSKVDVFGNGNKQFNQKNSPPIKVFEYMETGQAIIASDFLEEILENRYNALLCKEDNINEWREALTELCEDNDLRGRIGERAREDFLNNYSWFKRAQLVIGDSKKGN